MKFTRSDKLFVAAVNAVMFLVCIVCIYPLWYCFIISVSNTRLVSTREIWFVPRYFTLVNYSAVFRDSRLMNAFFLSVRRTAVGASVSVFMNAMAAYPLSKKYFIGRPVFMTVILITMFFSGGLVPWYLMISNLKLLNSFWGFIIPSIYSAGTIIIMRSFFSNIPIEMDESAKLDGASDLTIFFRIYLPLSKAMLATMLLFSAVGHWNDWFTGDFLMTKQELKPLSTVLMELIVRSNSMSAGASTEEGSNLIMLLQYRPTPGGIKMAAVMVSTVPILVVYPFLQKYFAHGIMIGSVKG